MKNFDKYGMMETNEKSIHNTQLINLILQTSMPIQQKYFGLLSRSKAIHLMILIKGLFLSSLIQRKLKIKIAFMNLL